MSKYNHTVDESFCLKRFYKFFLINYIEGDLIKFGFFFPGFLCIKYTDITLFLYA